MPAAQGMIVEGGRVILPASFRTSMGLAKGDTVLMELHDDEVRIRPARSALRRLHDKLRNSAPEAGSVSEGLIVEAPAVFSGNRRQASVR